MVGRRSTMSIDDKKERVLSWLDKHQRNNKQWYSVTSVAREMHISFDDAKKAVQGLMDDGFLWVRHEPSEPERIVFRLRRDGDQT